MHIIVTICQRTFVKAVSGAHLWIPAWNSYTKDGKRDRCRKKCGWTTLHRGSKEITKKKLTYLDWSKYSIPVDAKARIQIWAPIKRILHWWAWEACNNRILETINHEILILWAEGALLDSNTFIGGIRIEREKIIPKNSGYQYDDDQGDCIVELHIDSCHIFEEKA